MSQLILFAALHVLGVTICMAVGPWQRSWLCSAVGFAVGLASMVFVSVGALLLGVFQFGVMATLYAALLGAASFVAAKRQRWTRRSLAISMGGALGFTALCFPFCFWNFSAFSYDSHMFVMYGRVIGADGDLSLEMLAQLDKWGMFQVVAHAMSAFVKQDYLYGLAPAFAISMLASFAMLLDEALCELRVTVRRRALWVGLAVLVLIAIPLFRFHMIYIHSNMGSSGYLLLFVGLFWLAEVRQDASYVPLAFLALLSFSVLRVEAIPYTVVFLVVTVMESQFPKRVLLPWYLAFSAFLVVWFSLLGITVPADSVYLTPTKCLLFVLAILLLFVYWAIRERTPLRHLSRYLSHLAVVACVLGIGAAAITHGDNMRESAAIWLGDLWKSPWWASFWNFAVVLAVVSVFLPAPAFRKPFVLGVLLFFGLTLVVSSTGTAFGPDIDGSLIRMTIHILPIVVFYGALKFAPLLSPARAR